MSEMKDTNKTQFWSILWDYTKPYRFSIFIATVFSMLTGIGVALQPLIIKFIVDQGILNTTADSTYRLRTVVIFSAAYVGLGLMRIGFWSIGYHNMLKALEGFLFEIRSQFFRHVQGLCVRFHEEVSSGELFNYIMGSPMGNLKNFLQQMATSIPSQSIALVISLSTLFYFDWVLTLILLAIICVNITLNHYSRKKIRRLSKDFLETESEASKYITDMLHGSRAIKLYSVEDNIYNNFEKYATMMREKGKTLSFRQTLEHFKPEMTQYCGTAIIYIVGAFSCIYRGLTTGTLFAFMGSMGVMLNTLNTWLSINLLKSSAEASLDRIMNIMHTEATTPEPPDGKRRDPKMEKEHAMRHQSPCISFENVTFGYDDEREIFSGFCAAVSYNESVALVGGSGSGKSTFTKLAMRLYDPSEGEVKIHDRSAKDYSLHDLRSCFGIVPQDPFLFQTTILENIRVARPESTMLELIRAMEIAHVHEFVNELPNGWNTLVGEGGFSISGGQKQRIAIARAVLGNPDILIFDEATSALDNISEKHIQEAMEELMKTHTVIIVAHRLTTIRNVDRILVFEGGAVVQEGTYSELLSRDGVFKELASLKDEE